MQEHRHIIRWQINREARVKLEGAGDFIDCRIKDINFKGICIALKEKLPVDSFLKLSIALSEEFVLEDTEVWVVWHKSSREGLNHHGLYFNRIKDSDREKIYQFSCKYFSEALRKQQWSGIENGIGKGGGQMQEEEKKTEDKRIFARIPASLPVRILNINSNRETEAKVEDVSAKGIGFVGEENLNPRTALEMWLKIPDKGEPLYTRGEVVWSKRLEGNKYRVGVNLEKADLMGLSRVLRTT